MRHDTRMPLLLARLCRVQAAHPFAVLLCVLLSAVATALLATRLQLLTDLGDLLPRGKRSVLVAEQVQKRLPSVSTFMVVAQGKDDQGLERFVDALAPELAKLPARLVTNVDSGMQATERFFDQHKLLYAPLDLIEQLHDEVEQRYEYEVAVRAGTWLDDEDVPPAISEESIRARVEARRKKAAERSLPGGYYLDEKRHAIVVRMLSPLPSGDVAGAAELTSLARAAVERVGPARFDPALKVGFTGDLLTSAEVHEQIKGDLAHVGFWGVAMVLGVTLLFFLRVRTLVCMALTVGVGTAWTFGLAYAAIGHLNSSTGFLFSIVVGNGINFGIIYMARYLEERDRAGVIESLERAHAGSWAATLTVAAAATTAYGSLAITEFRGFKHFGLIGGSGMLFCWLATVLLLPPLLIVSERVWPIAGGGLLARARALYGRPFALLVGRAPRAVAAIGAIACAGSLVLAVRYWTRDPMEYDLGNVDNAPALKPTETRRLMDVADGILPRLGLDGVALATDRIDEVEPLAKALRARRAEARRPPFGSVVTIDSLLPRDQQKKIGLLRDLRATVEHAHAKGYVSDADWHKLDELMPGTALSPIGSADLPETVARPFTEKDGTRGRLVYLAPAEGRSVWDAHYLIEWADSFRETTLPDGSKVEGSGRTVIYADMILAVIHDAPRAILASLLGTALLVLIAFRRRGSAFWVLGSLVCGLSLTVAVLAVAKSRWPWEPGGFAMQPLRLNFLNFVALPITVGVGSDYAINVMKRFEQDRGRDIRKVIVETGGAVILCSLTTMLGYLALTLSVNRAIVGFGVAAAAGEICCVITAVLFLPAALSLVLRARPQAVARRSRHCEGKRDAKNRSAKISTE